MNRRAVLAIAAGLTVGAAYPGLDDVVDGTGGDDTTAEKNAAAAAETPAEPEWVVAEQVSETVTVPARTEPDTGFYRYEIGDMGYVEWSVAVTALEHLVDVYVMEVEDYNRFVQGDTFWYLDRFSEERVHESSQGGRLRQPDGNCVVVVVNRPAANPDRDQVEVSFEYTGKRLAGDGDSDWKQTGASKVEKVDPVLEPLASAGGESE
jgi:hypothetical protein